MEVDVVGDTRASHAAEVDADVEPFRAQLLAQDAKRQLDRGHQLGGFLHIEVGQIALVGGGRDQDVPAVVRELVQKQERPRWPVDDQLGLGVGERAAEQAARLRLAADVLHAPGRVEVLH